MIRNRWGVRPIDADLMSRIIWGVLFFRCIRRVSIIQSANDRGTTSGSENPWLDGILGAKGASGSFVGEGSISDKFHNTTWSYVMCLFFSWSSCCIWLWYQS